MPPEVSCLRFVSVVGWKRFNLSHPNQKLKIKKKSRLKLGTSLSYYLHFFSFFPLICFILHSSSTIGSLMFSPHFPIFPLISLFFTHPPQSGRVVVLSFFSFYFPLFSILISHSSPHVCFSVDSCISALL